MGGAKRIAGEDNWRQREEEGNVIAGNMKGIIQT